MKGKKLVEIVGGNIAYHRRQLGVTQEELAEKVSIGQDSISRLEKGKMNPKFERLQDFADALNCRVVDLFYADNDILEGYGVKFMDIIKPLSSVEQKEILDIVTHVARMLRKYKEN